MGGNLSPINSKVKKSILLINKYSPEENGELWLTASELHDSLVHCGVHPVLTVDIVNDILRLSNKEEIFLKKSWPYRAKVPNAEEVNEIQSGTARLGYCQTFNCRSIIKEAKDYETQSRIVRLVVLIYQVLYC